MGYFFLWTSISIDIEIPICIPAFTSFGYIPRSRISGSEVIQCLIFSGNTILISTAFNGILHSHLSTRNAQGFQFLHILSNTRFSCLSVCFNNSHPNEYLIDVFIFISLWLVVLGTFPRAYWPFMYLWRSIYSSLVTIFKLIFVVVVLDL